MTEIETLAKKIAATAYEAYSQTLHADRVSEWEKLIVVNVGDMACEITSMIRHEPAINRVGRVLAKELSSPNSTHDFNYQIECLNGQILNWSNCKMIKVDPLLVEKLEYFQKHYETHRLLSKGDQIDG